MLRVTLGADSPSRKQVAASRNMEHKASPNSAISRAFDLLEVISKQLRPISIKELSLELGLPRQSVHRLVSQLETLGVLARDLGSDRFSIGPRLKSLSLTCLSSHQQTSSSHAVLERLVSEVGETCNLGMLDAGRSSTLIA